ncbi:MAG: Flp pilus assembly protein CpaB [Elusimicrobiales bacterium]|nr:Flp pilus assembly protein CpaB [Elusimicrobiales bacterium]
MGKKGVLVPMILAIIAASIYWGILSSKKNSLASAYQMGRVLISKYDLPARTVLKEDLVEIIQVPRKYMQQDGYEVRSPSDIKMVVNLVTQIRIPKGNQITQSSLVSLSPKAGLSVKVPPGYRGCVLPMGNEILKLIKPGDRIDVLVTFTAVMAGSKKSNVTATILQNVLVLGVGGNLGQGISASHARSSAKQEAEAQAFSEKGVLSLALNPQEAQYLSLSFKEGDVSIIVRGLGDVEIHPMEIASFKRLIK